MRIFAYITSLYYKALFGKKESAWCLWSHDIIKVIEKMIGVNLFDICHIIISLLFHDKLLSQYITHKLMQVFAPEHVMCDVSVATLYHTHQYCAMVLQTDM